MIKGKLKTTLKEKCPLCKKKLQIRIVEEHGINNGIEVDYKREYIICSNEDCDYEKEVEGKRNRKREYTLEV